MLFYHYPDCLKTKKTIHPSIVTIGNYDGLHLGHKKILEKVVFDAKSLNLRSVAVIFEPQPAEFFKKDKVPARLMRLTEKLHVFKEIGLDEVLCLRFNKGLALLDASDFIRNILVDTLNAKAVIVGDDFCFGRKRSGTVEILKKLGGEFGFDVLVISPYSIDGIKVSSTKIREALYIGDLKLVEKLLGRYYSITGRVVHGRKLARDLGFRTANIALWHEVLPLSGVYIVKVSGINNKTYHGVANIGFRPTVAKNLTGLLEVHILDFDENIYGKKIKVEFLAKLRSEKKFESFEVLKKQIHEDILQAKDVLRNF